MHLPTLRKLESIVQVLLERYGRGITLGELHVATLGIRMIAEGTPISVTELAHHSGEPASNVSRWLRRVPHVELVDDDEDQRRKLIRLTDRDHAYGHLAAISDLFDRQF